ncbi:hypothetical protein LR48_Vigan01g104300 [Vigna angularis]|uniref:Uncharacterized protein n=1 Tax=Phaseolus angularis TaxID=3914 RepID=A0A0L9TLN7_PHAAN|nr:hypothetical protein LR48_Vigan01g104300 [Vigna angularis]
MPKRGYCLVEEVREGKSDTSFSPPHFLSTQPPPSSPTHSHQPLPTRRPSSTPPPWPPSFSSPSPLSPPPSPPSFSSPRPSSSLPNPNAATTTTNNNPNTTRRRPMMLPLWPLLPRLKKRHRQAQATHHPLQSLPTLRLRHRHGPLPPRPRPLRQNPHCPPSTRHQNHEFVSLQWYLQQSNQMHEPRVAMNPRLHQLKQSLVGCDIVSLVSGDAKSNFIVYTNARFVVIVSLENPLHVSIYEEHAYSTTIARFSPNGECVAFADASGTVRIWGTRNDFVLKKEFRVLSRRIDHLQWSLDGL